MSEFDINDYEQNLLLSIEGKPFEGEWINAFTLTITIPDIPIFEKMMLDYDSISFERLSDKNRMKYDLCGRSHQIAQLFIEFGKAMQS